MNPPKSIFDHIIQSRNIQEASLCNPSEIMVDLLKELNPKEREVVTRRFGLDGAPVETLEEIGKHFQITRERIRQIQSAAVGKIRTLAQAKQQLDMLQHTVTRLLQDYGGIIEAATLYEQLLSHTGNTVHHQQSTDFVLSQLLTDHVDHVRPSDHLHRGWKLRLLDLEFVHQALEAFSRIIDERGSTLQVEQLIAAFKGHGFFKENRQRLVPLGASVADDGDETIDRILQSYLTISRRIEQNILGEWGLAHWPTVRPRRMGDKIYLIFKQVQKPLHFTAITAQINQAKFDHKVAYPATIHNELILDDRYVLVGRGIYALKEWGFEPGTVADVVAQVIADAARPLTREEVVDEVGKRRLVRRSTIYLALTNKDRFVKVGGRYQSKNLKANGAT